jgi:hypothetical protein
MNGRTAGETLPQPQEESLANLIQSFEEKLQVASQAGATYAFNLGCSMSLIPGFLLVIGAFLLFRGSWIAAGVMGVLGVMAALGFANLVASIAKTRTMERTYQRDVQPEIERRLKQLELDRASFQLIAAETLPENAMLVACLSKYTL